MVQVIWTDAALQDLNDIGDFIAKDSVRYSEITVINLFEAVDILENHPRSGVITPEFIQKLLDILLEEITKLYTRLLTIFV